MLAPFYVIGGAIGWHFVGKFFDWLDARSEARMRAARNVTPAKE